MTQRLDQMKQTVSVVVVTHNSEIYIKKCIAALESQTRIPDQIVVVDSGSSDSSYLNFLHEKPHCLIKQVANIGYGAANNIGLAIVGKESEFVLIINPDTILEKNFIDQALELAAAHRDCAIITGIMSGYDIKKEQPTEKIDSTGIFRKWYGRWWDRGQGEDEGSYFVPAAGTVPAVCGALMFCRMSLIAAELPKLFVEHYFMYKEDIELSLRIRKGGGKLFYSPMLKAFHC